MTNAEKIKSEFDLLDIWNIVRNGITKFDCDFVKENVLKCVDCKALSCITCKKKTLEWLKKRHVDSEITEEEYKILKHLPKLWKYIARNKNGELYLFNQKPKYSELWQEWYLEKPEKEITFVKDHSKIYRKAEISCVYGEYIFPFIKYDENFWKIDDLMKMGEETYEISSDTD